MANDGQREAAAHVPRQEAWWEDAAAAQACLDEWDAKTSTIWGDKRCCALCGVGALGTTDFCQLRLQPPPQTEDGQLAPAPPALLLNSLTGSATCLASFYSTIVFLCPCNAGTTTQSHITNNSQALACPPPLRYISTASLMKGIYTFGRSSEYAVPWFSTFPLNSTAPMKIQPSVVNRKGISLALWCVE
jgi:hypothetical protein